MHCPACGSETPDDAQFCGVCGLNLISGEAYAGTELPRVGFGEAIKRGFTNYFTFSGRSTRAEYWWWTLFIVVLPFFLRVLDGLSRDGLLLANMAVFHLWVAKHPIPIVTGILLSPYSSLFFYSTVIPTIAMTSRRLHDVGISGWWQAAWLLMKVFSVGILGALYSGSVFFGVELIMDPVLPGTIPDIVMDAAAFLAYDPPPFLVDRLRDAINFLLPNWVVGVVLSVWVIVWTVRRSDDGPNKYGPDPRMPTSQ